jgi:diguanylate cyclase (GGDEF)-like protein
MNSSGNIDVLNISNRLTIIFSMFVILLALQFNKYFFDLPGKKDMFVFYILNAAFSVICLFDTPLFLAKKIVTASSYYSGLEFGHIFQLWGLYVIFMMVYSMVFLLKSYLSGIRKSHENKNHLFFLLIASIIWNFTGIIDALTGLKIIDVPPSTWFGSMIMILCIEIILVLKIENLHTQIRDLYEKVIHDSSTEVFSKNYFELELDKKISDVNDKEISHYLILIDIDDFKNINDSYGHITGDVVLKRIAEIMKQNIRNPDILARYGGDEFIMLMSHKGGIELTTKIIERIRFKIQEEEFMFKQLKFYATCSFGITLFDQDSLKNSKSRDEIITKADSALYQAKSQGKNKIHILDLNE